MKGGHNVFILYGLCWEHHRLAIMNRWPLYSSGHFSRFDGTLFQFIRSAVYRGCCLIPALMTLKGWRQLRSQLLHDTSVCISNKCPGQFRFNLTGQ